MSVANTDGVPKRPQHVPAWKRIGLKLKYAKDSIEDPLDKRPNGVEDTRRSDARGHHFDHSQLHLDDGDAPPAKKRRTSREPARDQSPEPQQRVTHRFESNARTSDETLGDIDASNDHHKGSNINSKKHPTHEAPRDSVSSESSIAEPRRKSVTFASDTKLEDGSSTLALAADGRNGQQHGASEADETDPNSRSPPTNTKGQSKAEKRRARNESTAASHRPSSQEEPDYVRYVELFHNYKDSWKFNKNKQNDLFKNLFNVYRIPIRHNPAILQYLSGLQGAGARQHLIGTATAVLKEVATKESESEDSHEDMSGLESGEARRRAYSAALRRQIERWERSGAGRNEDDDKQLEELRIDVERGQRAEAVLAELLRKELRSEPAKTQQSHTPATSNSTHNGDSKTKRKKRKSRTQGSSDESSSESEAGAKATPGPKTVHQVLSNRTDLIVSSKSPAVAAAPKKHVIFDDDLLDNVFGPKQQSYNETAPKRKAGEEKARGFAYTHGTRADESDSESDSDSSSSSESDSESDEDSDEEE